MDLRRICIDCALRSLSLEREATTDRDRTYWRRSKWRWIALVWKTYDREELS